MKVTRTITGDEPVLLPDMKQYLRVTHSEEDANILRMITFARQQLEYATGRSLVEQTIELEVEIDGIYYLPYGPISTISDITVEGDDVVVVDNGTTGKGTLIAEYDAGPYECQYPVMEYVAHMYGNHEGGNIPESVKRWIMNNTLNLWLQ